MATDELAAGTQLGNYRIDRLLGRGGMGQVYVATHVLLDKRVALKVLARQFATEPSVVQRFVREGRAAARVRHDHVIEVFDVGTAGDVPYLAMELLEGEPLAQRYARGPVPAGELASIMLPVAAAVATAHEMGIVHRDLKPDNVFLRRDARGQTQPVVLDFGISKLMEEVSLHLTDTRAIMGTPYYMSPEQARGAKNVTGATDQYALGVMMYEGATGKRPFEGDSLLELVHKITSGVYVRPEIANRAVPALLGDVIVRAMAMDATERYADLWVLGLALLPAAETRDQETWRKVFTQKTSRLMATTIAQPDDRHRPPSTTMGEAAGAIEGATRRSRAFPMLLGSGAVAVALGVGLYAGVHVKSPATTTPPEKATAMNTVEAGRPDNVDAGQALAITYATHPDGSADGPSDTSRKRHKKHGIQLSPGDF